ncbi:hypothetical protein SARC_11219 [Sphaeroforma arctica JP610]|uniref:Uncharacterized protein n=1 Tax=Sphaeroforma arctica JP610 TaxID=667725 RepID=A0A0L0FHM0_9EUKA|nr:hypothetical protein SARC_11219 [Sphaeroforma arctica JP610]KNC76274.1 hypothetical protein SARC_11219 [Sphaeroforma arctica JP610]|eukprot:XP_014150176.1 hypothetical protein SARC_11219 [Sphaeroforma arctica JP610]
MKVKSPPRDADVRTSELPQRPAMRSEVEENATENVYDSTLHTLSHSFKAMCTLEGASDSCMLIESTEISHGHGHGDMPTQAHTHTQDGVDSKARSSKGSLLSIRLVVNRDHILTSYDRATDSTTVVPTGGAGHTLPPNRATPMQKTRSFGDDANRWGTCV